MNYPSAPPSPPPPPPPTIFRSTPSFCHLNQIPILPEWDTLKIYLSGYLEKYFHNEDVLKKCKNRLMIPELLFLKCQAQEDVFLHVTHLNKLEKLTESHKFRCITLNQQGRCCYLQYEGKYWSLVCQPREKTHLIKS